MKNRKNLLILVPIVGTLFGSFVTLYNKLDRLFTVSLVSVGVCLFFIALFHIYIIDGWKWYKEKKGRKMIYGLPRWVFLTPCISFLIVCIIPILIYTLLSQATISLGLVDILTGVATAAPNSLIYYNIRYPEYSKFDEKELRERLTKEYNFSLMYGKKELINEYITPFVDKMGIDRFIADLKKSGWTK